MKTITVWLVPLLPIALVGCCQSPCKDCKDQLAPPSPPPQGDYCEPTGETGEDCQHFACPGNSPIANSFPLNGVRPDGECSPEGVRMVPGSMRTGRSGSPGPCEGATLEFDGTKLYGLRNGHRVCEDDADLKNVTFEVTSYQHRSARIRIADIQKKVLGPYNELRTVYLLEDEDGKNLCNMENSQNFRDDELKLKRIQVLTDQGPPPDGFVIPVRSELYGANGAPVGIAKKWKLQAPEWLQFACVHDALAERSLNDLNTDNLERRRATMRMLTADYCGDGHADARPRTMREMTIGWRPDQGKLKEACWSEFGAVCLDEPRLLHMDDKKGVPHDLPGQKMPPSLHLLCPDKDGKPCTVEEWDHALRSCRGKPKPIPRMSDPDCHCPPGGGADPFTSRVMPRK